MSTKPGRTGPNKLNLTDLIDQVSTDTALTKAASRAAVTAVLNIVVEQLQSGKTVGLPGVGVFRVTDTSERIGVRPGTSEKITIPAGHKISYRVATKLRNSLQP